MTFFLLQFYHCTVADNPFLPAVFMFSSGCLSLILFQMPIHYLLPLNLALTSMMRMTYVINLHRLMIITVLIRCINPFLHLVPPISFSNLVSCSCIAFLNYTVYLVLSATLPSFSCPAPLLAYCSSINLKISQIVVSYSYLFFFLRSLYLRVFLKLS